MYVYFCIVVYFKVCIHIYIYIYIHIIMIDMGISFGDDIDTSHYRNDGAK